MSLKSAGVALLGAGTRLGDAETAPLVSVWRRRYLPGARLPWLLSQANSQGARQNGLTLKELRWRLMGYRVPGTRLGGWPTEALLELCV